MCRCIPLGAGREPISASMQEEKNMEETVRSPSTTQINEHLLSPEQMAHYLGVTVRFVRKLTNSGKIPAIRVGKLPRYRLEDVIQALRAVQQVNHRE